MRVFSKVHRQRLSIAIKGRKLTKKWKEKISKTLKGRPRLNYRGKNHPLWKENVTYSRLHNWLVQRYGKATRCENVLCKKKCKTIDYALIKGKTYKKNRNNFIMLCRSCHNYYDKGEYERHIKIR